MNTATEGKQSFTPTLFPPQRGKEWYHTRGFKELAFIEGTTQTSYRKTSQHLNRIRYQPEATPSRTLQDNTEREGERILEQINAKSQEILKQHQFSSQGLPDEELAPSYEKQSPQHLSNEVVQAAITHCTQKFLSQTLQNTPLPDELSKLASEHPVDAANLLPIVHENEVSEQALENQGDNLKLPQIKLSHDEILQEMQRNPVSYEDSAQSINISVDDVGVKQQKEERGTDDEDHEQGAAQPTAWGSTPDPPTRKYAYQTVIHIQKQQSSYAFNGVGWANLLSVLIAFLVHNNLLQYNLIFFVDGQKTLHRAIQKAFAWFLPMQLILDWYHLQEKCEQQLSMALKGRKIRNGVLARLMPLLWNGMLDSAIAYLRSLEPELVKDADRLQALIDYFERNRSFIPCYSVRKRLGLRNSSNIGEKYNDLLVSERQKHNGMSWSKAGSVALAAIQALAKNQEWQRWFKTGDLAFKFAT